MTSCPTSWAEPICSRHRHSVLEIYRSVSRSRTRTHKQKRHPTRAFGGPAQLRMKGSPGQIGPVLRFRTASRRGRARPRAQAEAGADVPPVPRRHQTPIPGQNRHASYCPWPDVEPKNQKNPIGLAVACRRRRGSRPRQSIMDVLV